MFRKILVPLDHTPLSDQVFEHALNLAKATNATLMLLHVFSPEDDEAIPLNSALSYPELREEVVHRYLQHRTQFEEESLKTLQALTKQANESGVVAEFTQTAGSPEQRICALARTWNADLIVLGRRGRTGLNELILGSVSNYVVHHAPCSVLTVQHVNLPAAEPTTQQTTVGVTI
ncbi:universal stress protein [Leptolyngbya sp. AN02str]|uniref:universal stress protein n=1 Tax=Leptolyngbya sp. AN02str TaxID=3423363 RepID=UPI003D31B63F